MKPLLLIAGTAIIGIGLLTLGVWLESKGFAPGVDLGSSRSLTKLGSASLLFGALFSGVCVLFIRGAVRVRRKRDRA